MSRCTNDAFHAFVRDKEYHNYTNPSAGGVDCISLSTGLLARNPSFKDVQFWNNESKFKQWQYE